MIGSWIITPEAGRTLFFAAVVVFVGWFALGMFFNVRKGNAVVRWLQEGLPLIGQKTTLRWLGTSGVELKIQNPHKPLLNVEVFILLEPRDIPVLWAYFHARGRRDVLILRCQFPSIPRFELEAADPHAWSARGTQGEAVRKQWTSSPVPPGAGVTAYGEGDQQTAEGVLKLAAHCQLPLIRLAVRRTAPQLEVHWQLSRFEPASSRRLFETFLEIANRLSARP